ncbi:DUF2218 domain-containing protein [Nocardioides gilvus]|uniref:DUF2218 domain-containing protein n=1 Tax=Nocardioides gilvus TaxID=1735589 RepID=UPI000D74479F|nr:DUF2218 domain-containing protein [Nocardioides gilvus]
MLDTRALVATGRPARYGKQLTNHLGRKLGGEWDESEETGWVVLGEGRLTLAAGQDELVLDLKAPAADLARLEEVVGRHLVKFGARDDLVCAWTRGDGSEGTRQVMETEPVES